MKTLVILDYSTGSVEIYHVAENVNVTDDFIKRLGYSIYDCYYMFGDNINFISHSKILTE